MDGGTQGMMGRLGPVGRNTDGMGETMSRVESTQMYEKCHSDGMGGPRVGWEHSDGS